MRCVFAVETNLLTLYSDVAAVPVNWLWYPYIAVGKITLLQGDPGDGKSTMMMNLIAELSRGGVTPDGKALGRPRRVIYQCSEDGVGDTIKPRLEEAGAECCNIAFINEEAHSGLTLDDERIREAIVAFRPQLVVIDPIQSYIGNDSDLQIAVKARKLMRRVSTWAQAYRCAIVLIGHLSKRESSKDLYRGLGSIDVVASARSVLQVERDVEDENVRIVRQVKNSLAPRGSDLCFEIRPDTGFRWLSDSNSTGQGQGTEETIDYYPKNKHELASVLITKVLANGPVKSAEIKKVMSEYGIGEKTVRDAKMTLGVKAYRKMRTWYWMMPEMGSFDSICVSQVPQRSKE